MDAYTYLKNLPPHIQRKIEGIIESHGKTYMGLITPDRRSRVKAVKSVFYALDANIKSFLEQNPTTCRKGCSFCCHVFVYATEDEAQYIANYCAHNKIGIDIETLKSQQYYTKDNWADQEHNRCVFLKNGECSIYSVRPMACRKFYVASEPKLCDVNAGVNKISILNNMDAELLVSGIYNVREPDSLAVMLLKVLNPGPKTF